MRALHKVCKYGDSCVDFDGYEERQSIKEYEHQEIFGKTCAYIQLNELLEAHNNKQIFLSNKKNKSRNITLIYITYQLYRCHHSYSCMHHHISFSNERSGINVVADDTDVLVLLIYHWK